MVTNQQQVLMTEEIRTSIQLLQIGLAELNRVDETYDFYHVLLLLFSNGFERLMKIVYCLYHLKKQGTYPNNNSIKKGLVTI